MAAAVAELTGLPISKAVDLYEAHGSVEAAVAAHFDGGGAQAASAGATTGTGTRHNDGDNDDDDDVVQAAQPGDGGGPAQPSVDSILDQARARGDRNDGGRGVGGGRSVGAGRRLGDSSNNSGDRSTQRTIDVVFFRNGVAFLEKAEVSGGGSRKKGMHTFSSARLPAELDGLEDRVVVARLHESDADYATTIKLLNDSRVPPGGCLDPACLHACMHASHSDFQPRRLRKPHLRHAPHHSRFSPLSSFFLEHSRDCLCFNHN